MIKIFRYKAKNGKPYYITHIDGKAKFVHFAKGCKNVVFLKNTEDNLFAVFDGTNYKESDENIIII